jgi:hypothetical protein
LPWFLWQGWPINGVLHLPPRERKSHLSLRNWPPRSPDLTPCDFFLWEEEDLLQKVWQELDYGHYVAVWLEVPTLSICNFKVQNFESFSSDWCILHGYRFTDYFLINMKFYHTLGNALYLWYQCTQIGKWCWIVSYARS